MSEAAASLRPALEQLARGGIILLAGDRLRDGDIDLVAPARGISAAAINFLGLHGRGLICLAITPERALRLGIGLMNSSAERQSGRPFGQSIEARHGVDTGISAADRAHTVAIAAAEASTSDEIVSPGHVFPLITRAGGVRERPAAAEAAVDLCRMAGMGEAAVLCSVMRADGTMARIDDMRDFAAEQNIPVASLDDLLAVLETSG